MERPEHITSYTNIAIALVIMFHVVGLIGFLTPSLRLLFMQLVPYHLALMMVLLVLAHRPINTQFILFVLLILIMGFTAEWLGVHTTRLFGNYAYGNTLGLKFDGIPLTMCINWFLLIYCTGVTLQKSRLKNSWVRILAGSLLLVLLDILIEPVAVKFNYWHWASNQIPIKNYVCWFLLSAVLLFVFEKFEFKKQGVVAIVLLVAQFVFFGVLNF
jgi:putative membrane protein